jgi:hypothetical protein
MDNPVYIGDAVYAYFDGNGIELRLNRHDSKCVIYLEPEVIKSQPFLAGSRRRTEMKRFLCFLLFAALTAAAQIPTSPDEAKAWMIQFFQIPADAQIDKFGTGGSPVSAAWIHWSTVVNGTRISRTFQSLRFRKADRYPTVR